MRAIVYTEIGTPDVLVERDIPRPEPKAGEVLIRVRASTIDASVLTRFPEGGEPGAFARFALKHALHAVGAIPGGEVSGVVEAVGEDVDDFRPGEPVIADTGLAGGWAEYVCVPQHMAAHKPEHLEYAAAACVPVAGIVGLGALKKADVKPGMRVLVWGATGGVGSLTALMAGALGAEVTGAVRAARVAELAGRAPYEPVASDAAALVSQGRTFDAVIGVNGSLILGEAKRLLVSGGTYVAVGGDGAAAAVLGPVAAIGSGKHLTCVMHDALIKSDVLGRACTLVAGADIVPCVSQTFPLAEAKRAVRWTIEHHPAGRVVLIV